MDSTLLTPPHNRPAPAAAVQRRHVRGFELTPKHLDEAAVCARPAAQQPSWHDDPQLPGYVEWLRASGPLVSGDDVLSLREQLRDVAEGRALILQVGDCAEDPADSSLVMVSRKAGLIQALAGIMQFATGRPVLRVGRIGGQYAKPRSEPLELVEGIELPVYRGHLINDPRPDAVARRPLPSRLMLAYDAARSVHDILSRSYPASGGRHFGERVWTSHEALVLDYELPLVRTRPGIGNYLSSTHWPWIGNRTNHPDDAHVALAAGIVNPIACKVGPAMTVDHLLALCEKLDPAREAGRLTLIARMGVGSVAEKLPPLLRAVAAAGHPVIWLCDPMHGNTVRVDGHKTRYLEAISREIRLFRDACIDAGIRPGGLHLETAVDPVAECVAGPHIAATRGPDFASLCDPRLNPEQAMDIVSDLGGERW